MPDALVHFMSLQMQVGFAWGEADCMTMPADWVARVTGVDPMTDLRGRYSGRPGCHVLAAYARDPAGFVAARMGDLAAAGDAPERGDVGVVESAGSPMAHGAICLGARLWVGRAPAGVTLIEVRRVLAAWRVGLPRAAA